MPPGSGSQGSPLPAAAPPAPTPWGGLLTIGQMVFLGVAAEPADSQVGRLLHDVPQLASQS